MRISFTRARPRPRRRFALIALLSSVLLVGTVLGARPADAQTVTGLEHVCQSLGEANNIQTVICTDLFEVNYGNGTYNAYTGTEAICQNTASHTYLTCGYVNMGNETAKASSSGTLLSLPFEYGCGGDEYPDCATDARNSFGGTLLLSDPVTCITNVWGVTLAAPVAGETTEVVVGDMTGTLVNNLGTPHVNIGDC